MSASPPPLLHVSRLEEWRKFLRAETGTIIQERETVEQIIGISTQKFRENSNWMTRKQIRREYFSVADFDVRDRLITLERNEYEAYLKFWDRCIENVEEALEERRRAFDRPPWVAAAFCGAVSVAIGYVVASLPGAIGGAVAGYFLGQSIVSQVRASVKRRIEVFEAELEADRGARAELMTEQIFSISEAAMADPDFDASERAEFDRLQKSETR